MTPIRLVTPLFALALAACSNTPIAPPSAGHIQADQIPKPAAGGIPKPVQSTVALARPKAAPKVETYSVVVNNVRVQDLLFALARDARVNVDIHPGINGTVTLNAIDQTLQQLLTRIARQVDMRWEMDGPNLAVMPDTPYLRNYRVDYVNMSRDTSGTVAVTTQIAATGTGTVSGAAGGGGNNSLTEIKNKAQNRFWETLEKNVKDLLRETDKILPEGSSETVVERAEQQSATGAAGQPTAKGAAAPGQPAASSQQAGTTVVRRTTFREAASVIVNPESGIVTVRATSRQHEKVQEFLDQVMASARRQVLIETTVAEVTLSDQYQQGINWERLRNNANSTGLFNVKQNSSSITDTTAGLMTLVAKQVTGGGVFTATIKLLETFGTVKVLSSPKLSVINNQTAVLKVVDNLVYFTVKADTTTNQATTTTTYTTNLHSVPVGLVMNVTPQISENDTVLLNIRPSISRKYAEIEDPNPELKKNGLNIKSTIPVIRTREMESMIRVESGNVAVMGGLMEDSLENSDSAVPGLSSIPILGNLFQSRDDKRTKTELVVFLRPLVVKDASVGGDYASFRDKLPAADFFEKGNAGPPQQDLKLDGGAAK
ncbi:MAG: pilus (MSHA type) biogenesis protein MshL [Candidatus Nitricoxidivorans perseverans]|uniref:Pilus (MSHA type) biogenesis protein MshL n=1 Tax=Candidatus Nitricoxidivorans perseverans TaxID=2975601 RepID=A0AA49IZR3_9PROT|nr:MAG: pilus (MSHA type) biogenesis protein MshL [Candidatus Nitricoxidivorans perseverans]